MNPFSVGKVRDIYDLGDDRLLMVTSDRISAFDVVMAEPIPDKGRVLTAITVFWLDRLADVAPNHLISLDAAGRRLRRAARSRGPGHGRPQGGDASHRVHRAGLPVGLGVGRVPQVRHHARPSPARGPAPVRPAPRAGVHPLHQGHVRPRREHLLRSGVRSGRQGGGHPGPGHLPGGLRPGVRARRRSRDHHRRHQVRARLHRRPAGHLRRGPHPRLLPVLAGRAVGAGHLAAVVRQAAPPRLAGRHRLGQDAAAPRPACRGGHRHPRPLRRRLREADRRALHRLARGRGRV